MRGTMKQIVVTKYRGIPHECNTRYVSYVPEDGTLSEIRAVLEQDGIMAPDDKFCVRDIPHGRSAEKYTKLDSEAYDGGIVVLAAGVDLPARGENSTLKCDNGKDAAENNETKTLLDINLALLIQKSRLGAGIDIEDPEGPQQSGRVVIAAVDTSDVHCMETDHKAEVLITSSSRRAAYYRSGWTSRAASIHMPWIRSCQELSAVNETSIDRTLRYYVTGRFALSFCQLTLEDSVEPHPRFKEAIDNALAAPESRRTEELAEVFRRFGHVYVASVEMGGMKHTTTTRAGFTKTCLEEDMRLALHKKFGDGSLARDAPAQAVEGPFDAEAFRTIGGALRENDVQLWTESLADPKTWAVTRVLRVMSAITLFDEETQAKILAHAPIDTREVMEIGTICSNIAIDRRIIHFAAASISGIPSFLLGLNAFELRPEKNIRLQAVVEDIKRDQITFCKGTWHDSCEFHVRSGIAWLRVPPSDKDIQCGTFDTTEVYSHWDPRKSASRRVTFNRAYNQPPKVVVWLYKVDTAVDANTRVNVVTENISHDGFDIRIETWSDTTLYSAGASWFAYSASRTDLASGTYSTSDLRSYEHPQHEHRNRVSFTDSRFSKPPRVFMALKALDYSCKNNLCLDSLYATDITPDGMTWHINSWGQSVMYNVDASYLAFSP